jgi:murein DD-endopeptidase MepM/ murein hydrolase activator NlpD
LQPKDIHEQGFCAGPQLADDARPDTDQHGALTESPDRKGPMARTRWTLQLVPDGTGNTRSISLPRWALGAAVATAAALGVLALISLVGLGHGAIRSTELSRLRTENRHLTASLQEIRGEIGQLVETIDGIAAQEQRFRLIAGLPYTDPEVLEVGIGGPLLGDAAREEFFESSPELAGDVYGVTLDVDELSRRANLLSESLAEAIDSATVQQQLFQARPSILPVDGGDAWISSSFSRSRFHPILLYNRPHFGIDIAAFEGTPIRAAANGTVVYAGKKAGYGRTIEIDHGFGYSTVYAHAKEIKVRRGQKVSRGDEIGLVGRSGLATSPNLHYEVLVDDRPVNPRNYILEEQPLVE